MARKLKTYQTSLGFYDLAIAAPSMKAALQAWGSGSNLFHQGFAKEVTDGPVVEATMAKPGLFSDGLSVRTSHSRKMLCFRRTSPTKEPRLRRGDSATSDHLA